MSTNLMCISVQLIFVANYSMIFIYEQVSLNPNVLPFIPRSGSLKSMDHRKDEMPDPSDVFRWNDLLHNSDKASQKWSFSSFFGLDLPNENAEKLLGSTAESESSTDQVDQSTSDASSCSESSLLLSKLPCSPSFNNTMNEMVSLGSGRAPFQNLQQSCLWDRFV